MVEDEWLSQVRGKWNEVAGTAVGSGDWSGAVRWASFQKCVQTQERLVKMRMRDLE